MRSEILSASGHPRVAKVWNSLDTKNREPIEVWIESGSRSGELGFLEYSAVHDPGTSWNPAALYDGPLRRALGKDPVAWREMEAVYLGSPGSNDPLPKGALVPYGSPSIGGAWVSLLRLPASAVVVELAESLEGVWKPLIRVTYGPQPGDPESDREVLADELAGPKILAITAGDPKTNLAVGAWRAMADGLGTPERWKHAWVATRSKAPEVSGEWDPVWTIPGRLLVDRVSGVILGNRPETESPVQGYLKVTPSEDWDRTRVYQEGDQVKTGDLTWESVVDENIDSYPGIGGVWREVGSTPPAVPGIKGARFLVPGGGGTVRLLSGVDVTGTSAASIGDLKVNLVPNPGYSVGLVPPEWTKDQDGSWTVPVGSWTVRFVASPVTPVVHWRVPGINYYTLQGDRYTDIGVTYKSAADIPKAGSATVEWTGSRVFGETLTGTWSGLGSYRVRGVLVDGEPVAIDKITRGPEEGTGTFRCVPRRVDPKVIIDLEPRPVTLTLTGVGYEIETPVHTLFPGQTSQTRVYGADGRSPQTTGHIVSVVEAGRPGLWEIELKAGTSNETVELKKS